MAKSIVCTPDTCGGSPRIEGHRLTCANVALALYYSTSLFAYLADYPDLSVDDIRACLEYCANEKCLDDKPMHFCERCMHDKRPEERPAFFIDGPGKFEEYVSSAGHIEGYAFWGTEEEYQEDSRPKRIWEFARECLKNLSECPIAQDEP